MKKERFLLSVLATMTVLASCGRNAEISGETVPLSESADEAADLSSATMDENGGLLEDGRQAFGKALWDVYFQGILPDGGAVEYVDRESAEGNSFAVTDIDGDEREELLLLWSGASMSGMVQIIYGYEDGHFHEELSGFPDQTFYENGTVEIGWSHNQGLSNSLWPYFVYAYDTGSDTYRSVGGADAWEKSVREEDYSGNSFPAETDTDGDGMVYFILPADWDGQYEGIQTVDGEEYEEWRNSWLDGAAKMDISFQKLTAENIAALEYPKPDYPDPQPLG